MLFPEVPKQFGPEYCAQRSLTTVSTSTLGKAIPPNQQTSTPRAYQGGFYVSDRLVEYGANGCREYQKSLIEHNTFKHQFINLIINLLT